MCCEIKNNDGKHVLSYKPLLNKNSIVTIMGWLNGKKLRN